MTLFKNQNHPAVQELIRSHQELGEPIIDTSLPWEETLEEQVIREWDEKHQEPFSKVNPLPALPARPESVDRSLKTEEERNYWATRTPEKFDVESAESRKLTGLARNSTTLNDNQTKHFQQLRNLIDQAISDGHASHELLIRILRVSEVIAYEQTQFNGDVMEILLELREGFRGS